MKRKHKVKSIRTSVCTLWVSWNTRKHKRKSSLCIWHQTALERWTTVPSFWFLVYFVHFLLVEYAILLIKKKKKKEICAYFCLSFQSQSNTSFWLLTVSVTGIYIWDSSDISRNTQWSWNFSEPYVLVAHLDLTSFHYQISCLWR